MDKPIALLLKKMRVELGLTQEQLAEKVGTFGQTYVAAIEKSKSVPDLKHAGAIAKALGLGEQVVIDAIVASTHPEIKLISAKLRGFGVFAPMTQTEQERWQRFAQGRGWKEGEEGLLARKVLLAYVDAQEDKK